MTETIEAIEKLNKDLKKAAKVLTHAEVRYMVDNYYMVQQYRKSLGNQIRALSESKEPNELLTYIFEQTYTLEKNIKRALELYTKKPDPVMEWCLAQPGIGPVITAGLMAHIDITKAPTVGNIWSFAGLDPTKKWGKGQKRPWNASLKVLCWKAGESFVKVSNKEDAFYGNEYKRRKEEEVRLNEELFFKDQAAEILETRNYKKDTIAYSHYIKGQLPPAHIHSRAKRYAVKLFLAHLHEVWYREHYGQAPPLPYPIAHQNHAHYIDPVDKTVKAVF